jgi:outer membrane lipoprotein-sorting protein
MRRTRMIPLVSFLVFFPPTCFAQTQPDAGEIFRKIRKTYQQLKTYQIEYKRSHEHKREREELIQEPKDQSVGTIWNKFRNLSRTEAENYDHHVVKIVDGRTTWIYTPVI